MPFPRAALVILGLAAAPAASCSGDADPCAAAYQREDWKAAVATCGAAYQRTRDPVHGIRLAQASDYLDDLATSTAIARELAAGPEAARAHRLLAESTRRAGSHAAAATHAATALVLHATAGDDREVARDAHALAGVLATDGAYETALSAIALARDAAVRSRDRRMQGYSEMAGGDILRVVGDRAGAERAFDVAAGLLAPYCDRSWVLLKQAHLHMAQGQLTLAGQALGLIEASAGGCQQPDVERAVRVNRAWLAWRRGDLDAAAAQVAPLGDFIEAEVMRALVRSARGDIAGAAAGLTAVTRREAPSAEWAWLAPHLLAQVEELRGADAAAEAAYRRAIAAVGRARAASPTHAAYVAASHRVPYEGLFGLLARHDRWREALALVIELDASDMLRTTARPGALGEGGLVEAERAEARPIVTPTAGEAAIDVDGVLAAWAGRELVVIMVPSRRFVPGIADRAWRLHVRDGQVTGADVGAADAIELASERLLGDPRDGAAGSLLGAAVVPPGRGPLHVLPVGRVTQAPLAALRGGDALIVATRPLLRVLGLRPREQAAGPRRGAVVIADPGRDLAAAVGEARAVGAALGVAPHIGAAATFDRLAAARDADVLHVAAHADERAGRRVLHLADGDVSPGLVAAHRISPRLVVLASCGSAAARDEGGWGSLAAAFATAGSDHVLATQWSIDDAAAADLIRLFYAGGGVADPAAALAAAQVALARTSPTAAWAAFTLVAAPPPRTTPSPQSPGAAPGR
jgi:hypothetical protein